MQVDEDEAVDDDVVWMTPLCVAYYTSESRSCAHHCIHVRTQDDEDDAADDDVVWMTDTSLRSICYHIHAHTTVYRYTCAHRMTRTTLPMMTWFG